MTIIRLTCTLLALAVLMAVNQSLWAQETDDSDPLGDIAVDMQVIAQRLEKLATDKPVQMSQQGVVNKLDLLIKRLEDRYAARTGGTGGTRPAQASTIRNGRGGMGDLHGERTQGRDWGQLPEHERQRILQSLTQGFPSHYQGILERYFKRLAEEKPAARPDEQSDEADAEGQPASPKDKSSANAIPKPSQVN